MNEQITDTIANLMQNNKELKLSISEMNNVLSRLNGAIRADIDKQVDEAYQRGLNDAWEAAKKISLMSPDEIENVFPGAAKYNRYNLGYSGVEAIEKLKAYEEQKAADEIKVGDEVISLDRKGKAIEGVLPWFVTHKTEYSYQGFDAEGIFHNNSKESVRKTGRHFDIDKILKEMNE